MNIRLGLYDIFSRIVPGGFYLAIAVELARILHWIPFDWTSLKDLGLLPSLALALIAFVVGAAMDRLGVAWHTFFGLNDRVLDEFKQEHNEWKLGFQEKDWPILRAYVYIHNLDVADEIERHNALSIMLRNISLGLVLLALCESIQLVKAFDWLYIPVVAVLLFLSYQAGVQAKYMREWFYRSIYETIIAYSLNLADIIKPVKPSRPGKR